MSTYGSHPEQMTVKLTVGDGAHLVATSVNGWAGPVSLVWGPDDGQWTEETSTLTDVGTVDGAEVSWTLTVAEVIARSAFPYVRLVDNGMTMQAGEVIPWTGGLGSTTTQTIASLTAGPPGASAYQIALDDGFEGTEEEWLASLVGSVGVEDLDNGYSELGGDSGATLLNLNPSQVPGDGDGLVYDAASKKWLPGRLSAVDVGAVAAADLTVTPGAAISGTNTGDQDLSGYAALDALGIIQAIDHGIVADGTTDNTAALNTLMADTSTAGGGHIVLPAGILRTATELVPQSNVWLSGAGQGVTVIMPEQAGFSRDATALDPITNFHLSDLTVDGTNRTGAMTWKGYHGQFHVRCSWQNLTFSNTGMTGLGPDMLRECVISNVTTENTGLENDGTQPSGNGIGIGAGGFADWESVTIVGCTAINAKRYGIMIEGGLIRVAARIVGNMARNCGSGGYGLGAGSGAVVVGNTAHGNVGNGFEFSNLTLASSRMSGKCVMVGNTATSNGGHGIAYDASVQRPAAGHVRIAENVCDGNTGQGINVLINLSLIGGESGSAALITGFAIDGNTCTLNTAGGIAVTTTGADAGGYVPTAWTIDGNNLYRNGGGGGDHHNIRISTSMKGCSISRNTCYMNSAVTSGIHLGHGGGAVTLTGCRVEGNSSAAPANRVLTINAAATLTSCVVQNNYPDDGATTPRTLTANGTLGLGDSFAVSDGASTIYIPHANAVRVGRRLTVKNINATTVTLRFATAGSTIDGSTTKALVQWATATLVSDGVSQWLLI